MLLCRNKTANNTIWKGVRQGSSASAPLFTNIYIHLICLRNKLHKQFSRRYDKMF